jgi:hypothetical protein
MVMMPMSRAVETGLHASFNGKENRAACQTVCFKGKS